MAPTGSSLSGLSSGIGLTFAGGTLGAFFTGPLGIIALAQTFAGMLLLIYLILGGFSLMTSAGDPKKVQAGKEKITGAFIGFGIVFLSFLIVQAVGLILGLGGITNVFQ